MMKTLATDILRKNEDFSPVLKFTLKEVGAKHDLQNCKDNAILLKQKEGVDYCFGQPLLFKIKLFLIEKPNNFLLL